METMKGLHRTHGCGTISEAEVGKEVVLCGWVERRRDHGGLILLGLARSFWHRSSCSIPRS